MASCVDTAIVHTERFPCTRAMLVALAQRPSTESSAKMLDIGEIHRKSYKHRQCEAMSRDAVRCADLNTKVGEDPAESLFIDHRSFPENILPPDTMRSQSNMLISLDI